MGLLPRAAVIGRGLWEEAELRWRHQFTFGFAGHGAMVNHTQQILDGNWNGADSAVHSIHPPYIYYQSRPIYLTCVWVSVCVSVWVSFASIIRAVYFRRQHAMQIIS